MSEEIVIIGAGISGLSSAYYAKEFGLRSKVYEALNSTGGLLDNFSVEGFRFDNAVHLSFAKEPEVRKIFDQTEYNTLSSESKCFDDGFWLKHPVQNNLYPLPIERRIQLLESFVKRPNIKTINNYEEWLIHQYGDLIANYYPIKYTKKYWTVEAKELSTSWIGNRMRRAEFGEVLRGSMTPNTPNTYYTSEMRYPKTGGFKSFLKPLILASDVEFEKRVIKIDTNTHTVSFSDGSNVVYKQLISSMPMPKLVECIKDAPKEVKDAASSLYATSIDLVSIGFNKDVIKDLWFYIYDEDIFASRAYSPSMKSQDNVPNGCSSLQFEIYSSRHTTKMHTKQQLIDNSLYALEKLNIANKHDILFTHHKKIKYGNVVFDIGMEDRRAIIREFLDSVGILSIGRFGEWDYLWSNQAMMSGKRAIERILDGK